jgi:hypothetical protein
VAAVVFDAGGEAHFAQHFQVVEGALLDALRFQEHVALFEVGDALVSSASMSLIAWASFSSSVMNWRAGKIWMLVMSRSTSPVRASNSVMRSISSPQNSTV